MPDASFVTSMTELLDLEVVDRDLYRGRNEQPSRRPRLFGGQVAAQALRAAMLTVDGDRAVHSLHGYFLRPGLGDWPIIFRVHRDRDGRSFSARHVEAVQHGDVIFSCSASFHVAEHSGTYAIDAPGTVTPPEETPDGTAHAANNVFEIRELIDRTVTNAPGTIWARLRAPLPDEPALHACAVAYLSDLGTGFAGTDIPDMSRGGPSIDHAIWFHHPLHADDWILIQLWPLKAIGARGLYMGAMRDRAGTLGALLTQEMLMRPS